MWDDDFDVQEYDEGEAFTTIIHAGQKLVDELLRRRRGCCAAMAESDFVTLFDMVHQVFGGWIGPVQSLEIWDYTCVMYFECRKENEPDLNLKDCEKLLRSCLPDWYKYAHDGKRRESKNVRRKK